MIPDPNDRYWLLAYALLDSLSGDLRRRRQRGQWDIQAAEMQGLRLPAEDIPQPDDLLRELNSRWVGDMCEFVAASTDSRVRIGTADIIRRARQ